MTQNFLSIYAKSFNWAGFFLTKTIYQNSSNLYDFCRILDDITDQDLDLEIKKPTCVYSAMVLTNMIM